jgi:hypothetical protein
MQDASPSAPAPGSSEIPPFSLPADIPGTAGAGAVLPVSSASHSLSVATGSAADAGAAAPAPLSPAPLDALAESVGRAHSLINSLAKAAGAHGSQLATLDQRLGAVQSTLADLDTPADNAALEVILQSVAKPGIHTTEFWLNLLGAVGTLALAFSGHLSGGTAAWITFGVATLHTWSRSSLKGRAAKIASKALPLLAALLCLSCLTGCGVGRDLQTKSTNMGISGAGVIAASSGVGGAGTFSIAGMNHLPGDGTQVYIDTEKSIWSGSAIGSQIVRVNCRDGIKALTFSFQPAGPTTLAFDDGAASATSLKK